MEPISRRQMIAALALARPAASQGNSGMTSDFFDAHVHVWTAATQQFPHDPHYSGPAYEPARFTPEDLFQHTRPSGVSRVVLIQMSFYGFDNSYMLDAIRRYPGVFRGVAIIDSSRPKPENEMLRLARHGVRGFRITPGSQPRTWLQSSGMESMWRCGAEAGLAMCPLIGPEALESVNEMCRRFPKTPVVIDHISRIGSDGQIRTADVQALRNLARHPNVHVKISAFYALGRKQPPYTDLSQLIRSIHEAFGPQRLMWASDSPFQVQPPHTYTASLDLIRTRLEFLSADDREWLLRKTAEKIFFGPLKTASGAF